MPSLNLHPEALPLLLSQPGVQVVGTDTEIGKTTVSCALLEAMVGAGRRAAGFKPIAAGTEPSSGVNDDVARLLAAGHPGLGLSAQDLCRRSLSLAASPWVAAEAEGQTLAGCIPQLLQAARALQGRGVQWLLVEGVGGVRVPLAEGLSTRELHRAFHRELGLGALLVVGLRLGCHSHALLTLESLRAAGIPMLGWVGNACTAAPYDGRSLEVLTQALRSEGLRCLGLMPRLSDNRA